MIFLKDVFDYIAFTEFRWWKKWLLYFTLAFFAFGRCYLTKYAQYAPPESTAIIKFWKTMYYIWISTSFSLLFATLFLHVETGRHKLACLFVSLITFLGTAWEMIALSGYEWATCKSIMYFMYFSEFGIAILFFIVFIEALWNGFRKLQE